MSSETSTDSEFEGLESAEAPPAHQTEVEELIDAHLAARQEESSARQRRMEYIKFGILAAILLITILVIALTKPLIFGRIVPAVMNGDSSITVTDETSPPDITSPVQDNPEGTDTAVPGEDNTQNLPIISVPGDEGAGTGGEGEAAATAVPAQIYVVQQGDTLNSIARQFNTSVDAIVAANNIQNPDALQVGTTLTIPQATP